MEVLASIRASTVYLNRKHTAVSMHATLGILVSALLRVNIVRLLILLPFLLS